MAKMENEKKAEKRSLQYSQASGAASCGVTSSSFEGRHLQSLFRCGLPHGARKRKKKTWRAGQDARLQSSESPLAGRASPLRRITQ